MTTTNTADIIHHLNTLGGIEFTLQGDFKPFIYAVFLKDKDAVYPPFLDIGTLFDVPNGLPLGATVRAEYTKKLTCYFFTSTIVGIGDRRLTLSIPNKITIKQRRNNLRVRPLNQLSISINISDKCINGTVYDISQGGVCVLTRESFSSGEKVRSIRFALPSGIMTLEGVVGFSSPTMNGMFKSGIQFLYLKPNLVELLKKYIIDTQKGKVGGGKLIG